MNLTARERRILKLAQGLAAIKARNAFIGYTEWSRLETTRKIARDILKLFPKAALKIK